MRRWLSQGHKAMKGLKSLPYITHLVFPFALYNRPDVPGLQLQHLIYVEAKELSHRDMQASPPTAMMP